MRSRYLSSRWDGMALKLVPMVCQKAERKGMKVWAGNERRSEAREAQIRCWGSGEAVWWMPVREV